MERSLVAFDQNLSGAGGDFPVLLRRKGLLAPTAADPVRRASRWMRSLQWNNPEGRFPVLLRTQRVP